MADVNEASPICRGKNLSWETVLLFFNNMPRESMPKAQFNSFVESRINGWAQTHSQIARQLAFYYEKNGVCYPRFTGKVSYADLFLYMQNWASKYFIPNPYAPSLEGKKPTCIYSFVRKSILDGNTDFDEVLDSIFDVKLSSHDKVNVYLSNFTDIIIDGSHKMKLSERTWFYDSVLYPSNDIANDVEEYFNYFSTQLHNQVDTLKSDVPSELRQQIFFGAPGTGKSHKICKQIKNESLIRTTFHPDSDYSTFVGAYKPTTKEVELRDVTGHKVFENGNVVTEDHIVYEFVEQAFLQAYVLAWKYYAEADDTSEPKKQFLVIEEINRGNCAQIFGDLFQLLDRNHSGFSDYPINADNDMKKQLAKAFKGLTIAQADKINACYKGKDVTSKVLSGEILLLPNNLYIWATMNTSDQSLFPIDSAFKRRWDWQYMPICKGRDENGNELNWKIAADTKEYDWWSFLTKINDHINSTTNSEDKKLGFFFCKPQDGCISSETFVGKVIFYLWNDVFKDFGFDGPIFKDIDGSELSFNKFYKTDDKGIAVVQKDKVELFLNNLGVDSWDISYDESYTTSSAFRFNGGNPDTLGNIAKAVVEKYANDHPSDSAQSIRDLFVNTCKGIGVAHIVETESEYHLRDGQSSQKRSSQELTMPNGEKIYVSTQWRAKNDDDNFMKFIKIVKDNNWGEITCDLNTAEGLDIDSDTVGAGKAEHKETLVAVTINGERLTADGITQFDLYLNAIKKIGVDKIGPALEAMKYRRKGSPMATKKKVQGVLDSEGYSYVEADGYYFVKGANGYTLVRILEDLNKSLNLNIQIEYR